MSGVLGRVASRWPTEVAPGLRASAVGLGNLVTEELVEGFGDLLRRASLDDIPVGKPMAEEFRQASRAGQDDVRRQPPGLRR